MFIKNKENNIHSAAIVVLYNPNKEVMENLSSFKDEVDKIYLVDNSLKVNSSYDTKEYIYIPLNKNVGFCRALNIGCQKAIEDGNDVLITLNQDTFCPKGTVKKMIQAVINEPNKVYGPNYKFIYRNNKGKRYFSDEKSFENCVAKVPWVMTSGNAFSREAFIKCGGYDDSLFVDLLDVDFCIRLAKNGYSIIRKGDVFVFQEPGNTKTISIGIKTLHIPNLSPNRYYYIFRNERYLRRKYGEEYKTFRVKLYKYLVSILFFEKNKINKLKACILGSIEGKKDGNWPNEAYNK